MAPPQLLRLAWNSGHANPSLLLGSLLLVLGGSAPAQEQGWRSMATTGMAARGGHAMVWDDQRRVLVLFGGQSPFTGSNLSDTWVHAGSAWREVLAVVRPSPRTQHAMAWDAIRGAVVLHGGMQGSSYLADTWEWDGSVWRQMLVTAPAARARHGMAWDGLTGRVLLFGGRDGSGTFSDTWHWDGTSWIQRVGVGPSARHGHAMAWDPGGNRVVCFGGEVVSGTGSAEVAEHWEWQGSQWSQRPVSGPAPRSGHVLAADPMRGRLLLYGGQAGGVLRGDAWEWDGTAWSALPPGPSPRRHLASGFQGDLGGVLVQGGFVPGSASSETWLWDGVQWTPRTDAGLAPREAHAMAFDVARGRTVLFGGTSRGFVDHGDTLEWDGVVWRDQRASGPAPRFLHAMAFDAVRAETVLFGGLEGISNAALRETWSWNGVSWTLRSLGGPPARHGHAMAWDQARGRVLLHGGTDGSGVFADTWEWDGASWLQRASGGPPARSQHAIGYDPLRQRAVLFGGRTAATNLGDTWEWDGLSWSQHSTLGPSARSGHGFSWNPQTSRCFLHGGRAVAVLSDAWEWDGNQWIPVTSVVAVAAAGHGVALDAARGRLVAVGGEDAAGRVVGSTWEYGPGTNALATSHGSGCGSPPLALSCPGGVRPVLGTTLFVSMGAVRGSLAFLSAGTSRLRAGAFALPLPLDPYGMPGCELLQSMDLTLGVVIPNTAPGAAQLQVVLPNQPALLGQGLHLQGFSLDPLANPAGIVTSNGLELRFGDL